MGTLALIGLGSNLGDRRAHLDAAVAALAETPGVEVRAVSSYHETAPVGGPGGQGAFLNAAAALATTLKPLDLLHRLQDLEQWSGRVRTGRWGERPLDLDLLLFGDRVINTGRIINRVFGGSSVQLQVPHPLMALRRFVLSPLAEIAPESIDPCTGRTVASLLANVDRRPSYVAFHVPLLEFGERLFPRLAEALAASEVCSGKDNPFHGNWPQDVGSLSGEGRRPDESWFEQVCQKLDPNRWPPELWADRWLVTNFWLDGVVDSSWAARADSPEFWMRFLKTRARVIAPTFVVTPRGWGRSISRSSRTRHAVPPLGDVPVLEVDPGNPEAVVAEVLAACAATRSGDPPTAPVAGTEIAPL